MSFRRASLDDFWREVTEVQRVSGFSPCWEFAGSPAYLDYRAFRSLLAHRVAACIYTCEIPGRVNQRCGNPACVRVDHLNIHDARPVNPGVSPNTGRPLTPSVCKDADTIARVLAARPESGRYRYADVAKTARTTTTVVKKILREAPLYDLIAEITRLREARAFVRMEPHERIKANVTPLAALAASA